MVDLNRILSEERKNLSLIEALKLVESYGLPVARYIILRSRDDIPSVGRIGFPLVLKVSSPKIIHKTEIGGVKIGLKSLDEVYRAYDEMIDIAKPDIVQASSYEQILVSDIDVGKIRKIREIRLKELRNDYSAL